MKKVLFLFILITFSCSKTKTITLRTENADGISNGTKLKVKGIEIGKIESIKLTSAHEVRLTASVESTLNFPIDSKFEIQNEGIIGSKIITVYMGKEKDYLTEKNIIDLQQQKAVFGNDSIVMKINTAIDSLKKSEDSDAIRKELKRLNDNLEKLSRSKTKI